MPADFDTQSILSISADLLRTAGASTSSISSSPLLPERLASAITYIALGARISLRASALLLEAVLETARYGTSTTLGITRRALLNAVNSARMLHGLATGDKGDGLFAQILDKYTNVGIYIVHHGFTLVELFAMSGFYLTTSTIKTSLGAAEESVRMIDGIFGSNESSRALASIVSLVKNEFSADNDDFKLAKLGRITVLTGITKALTAFACLQNATRKRTLRGHKMFVMYDCTVVEDVEEIVAQETIKGGDNTPDTQRRRSRVISTLQDESKGSKAMTLIGQHPELAEKDGDSLLWELENMLAMDEGEKTTTEQPEELELENAIFQELSKNQAQVYEITTTTTQVTTVKAEHWNTDKALPDPHQQPSRAIAPQSSLSRERSRMSGSIKRRSGLYQEDEWVEVERLVSKSTHEGTTPDFETPDSEWAVQHIPSASNGRNSIATRSRHDMLNDSDQHGKQKLQVVLQTVTKKLMQRKRIVRSSEPHSFHVQEEEFDEHGNLLSSRARRIGQGRALSAQTTPVSSPSTTAHSSRNTSPAAFPRLAMSKPKDHSKGPKKSFMRAISKARSQLSKPRLDGIFSGDEGSAKEDTPDDTPSGSDTSSVKDLDKENLQPFPHDPRDRDSNAPLPINTGRRRRQSIGSVRSIHTFRSHTKTTSTSNGDVQQEPKPSNFPKDHFVRNIYRFMRYASAAYGQNFMRILGIGTSEYNFATTDAHHANHHSFAFHTNVPIDAILLSSYTAPSPAFDNSSMQPIVHYVTLDEKSSAIVLTLRGTLGLADALTDLTCEYDHIQIPDGDPNKSYKAHSGMLKSALGLSKRWSQVFQAIDEALRRYPDYGLVICGHSLGGGVGALLAMLWSTPVNVFRRNQGNPGSPEYVRHPPIHTPFVTSRASGLPAGRPIHCYAYGTPCVASVDLGKYARGLVTSIVHNYDVVCCLSFGLIKDFKNIAVSLYEESHVAEEIVGRVVGLHQRRRQRDIVNLWNRTTGNLKPASATLQKLADESSKGPKGKAMVPAVQRKQLPPQPYETRQNRALDPNYVDPALEDDFPDDLSGPTARAEQAAQLPDLSVQHAPSDTEEDEEVEMWMWSLIKTMRADMKAEKLYPPGDVMTVDSIPTYVADYRGGSEGMNWAQQRATKREAHRVILRKCLDVEARFGEITFSRRMFTTHSPKEYEDVLRLLHKGVFG